MAQRQHGKWNGRQPPDQAWRCPPNLNKAGRTAEQDRAAGGRANRLVDIGGGRVTCASIELKVYPQTRRIRAYVRWSDHGKYPTKYVGEVGAGTRRQNLKTAWRMVIDRCLLPRPVEIAESWATTPAVRSSMRGNRRRDTQPELALRSQLRALRLGYRVDARPLPDLRRTADVVFFGPKVAVFCDGCYWHGCPEHYRPARSNSEFWATKIATNRARDRDTDTRLKDAGWTIIRVWEHEDPRLAANRIAEAVTEIRRRSSSPRQ